MMIVPNLSKRFSSLLMLFLYIFFTIFNNPSLGAQTDKNCAEIYEEAKKKFYLEVDPQAAINLLEPCLKNGVLDSLVLELKGYELLGQSALDLGDSSMAIYSIRQILKLNPQYNPDTNYGEYPLKQGFRDLVMEVKGEDGGWWPPNKWYIIGAGVVAVGVVVWVIRGKGGNGPEPDEFPNPPARP